MNTRQFAPSGRLRAAINLGNPVLAARDRNGQPQGISVELARELARTLEVELDLIEFDRAFDVAEAADENKWDICFLAVDPARAATIAFTQPYVRLVGSYLVREGVHVEHAAAMAEGRLAVGVVQGSAYTLHLSRSMGADSLVTYPTFELLMEAFDRGEVDAIAGIEPVMKREAELRPGARVLQPPFMEIRQAMGLPSGRKHVVEYLQAWLASLRGDGCLGLILERGGLSPDCAL